MQYTSVRFNQSLTFVFTMFFITNHNQQNNGSRGKELNENN